MNLLEITKMPPFIGVIVKRKLNDGYTVKARVAVWSSIDGLEKGDVKVEGVSEDGWKIKVRDVIDDDDTLALLSISLDEKSDSEMTMVEDDGGYLLRLRDPDKYILAK